MFTAKQTHSTAGTVPECVCIFSVNEYCVNVATALTVTYRAGKYVWGLEAEEFLFPLFISF